MPSTIGAIAFRRSDAASGGSRSRTAARTWPSSSLKAARLELAIVVYESIVPLYTVCSMCSRTPCVYNGGVIRVRGCALALDASTAHTAGCWECECQPYSRCWHSQVPARTHTCTHTCDRVCEGVRTEWTMAGIAFQSAFITLVCVSSSSSPLSYR